MSLPCAPILNIIHCSDLNATSWQTEQSCKKGVEQCFCLRSKLQSAGPLQGQIESDLQQTCRFQLPAWALCKPDNMASTLSTIDMPMHVLHYVVVLKSEQLVSSVHRGLELTTTPLVACFPFEGAACCVLDTVKFTGAAVGLAVLAGGATEGCRLPVGVTGPPEQLDTELGQKHPSPRDVVGMMTPRACPGRWSRYGPHC